MQMPGPRDIVIYWPGPQAFFVVQEPWSWAHISVQKPRGAGGGVKLIPALPIRLKQRYVPRTFFQGHLQWQNVNESQKNNGVTKHIHLL